MQVLLCCITNSKNQQSQHHSNMMMRHLAVLIGRASQTRFRSEQPILATQGGMLYFILFCLLYTRIYYTDACIVLIWASHYSQWSVYWLMIWVVTPTEKRRKSGKEWANKLKEMDVAYYWNDLGSHRRWSIIICDLWGFGVWAIALNNRRRRKKRSKDVALNQMGLSIEKNVFV